MKSISVLACTVLVLGSVVCSPVYAQKGEGVKPPGNGPIPRGKSGVIDEVLGSAGWGNCTVFANSWCSPNSEFYSNGGGQPKKATK